MSEAARVGPALGHRVRRPWRSPAVVLVLLCAAQFMVALDSQIVDVALFSAASWVGGVAQSPGLLASSTTLR